MTRAEIDQRLAEALAAALVAAARRAEATKAA